MPLTIDRVETELEVMRSPDGGGFDLSGGSETLGALRGRTAELERLRPLVLEIMHDELDRMKRKVGAP